MSKPKPKYLYRIEADLFGMMSATDEMKEGMAAFLQKRKPTWLRQ